MGAEVQMDFATKIVDVQAEIGEVKTALRKGDGGKHLGMAGDTLAEYLLQLTKQESSLLEIMARSFDTSASEGGTESYGYGSGGEYYYNTSGGGGPSPYGYGPGGHGHAGSVGVGGGRGPVAPSNYKDHQVVGSISSTPSSRPGDTKNEGRLPPMDPSKPLDKAPVVDKDDVESVLNHLEYAKDACAPDVETYLRVLSRSLKSLASLVYKVSNAQAALKGGRVVVLLDYIMRQYDLGDGSLSGFVAGCVCNLAYDGPSCAQLVTASGGVSLLISLLNAMSLFPTHNYLHQKASEAIARILTEEAEEKETGTADISERAQRADPTMLPPALLHNRAFLLVRVLALARGRVFSTSVTSSENPSRSSLPPMQEESFAHWSLVETLIQNEALTVETLADEVVANLAHASSDGRWHEAVFVGICALVSAACGTTEYGANFSSALRNLQMTQLMLDLSESKSLSHVAARGAIEAIARIISTSMEGLELFVSLGGASCFQLLMDRHSEDKILQARAIRALASSMDWPDIIREKAAVDHAMLLHKVQHAMTLHLNDAWLLCAGFEGFYKFLPMVLHTDPDLVRKVSVTVHEVLQRFPDDTKLIAWGTRILDIAKGPTSK
ncbi:unnamed protein product [Amoebophrya sp. A25]|nr:unnamed protein product [Amoebophrya sp. A25]|eukprot:GSA25T00006804001.1